MGKKPTEPEVLALGGYHGKTSKVGTAGLGEGSLVSVVVYLVILAVNESMSIKAEEGSPPTPAATDSPGQNNTGRLQDKTGHSRDDVAFVGRGRVSHQALGRYGWSGGEVQVPVPEEWTRACLP